MINWQDIHKVWIWSQNPVKIQSVKMVFEYLGKKDIEYVIINAPSWVSAQPVWNVETINWAINRAKYCLEQDLSLDIAFGIEWSVEYMDIPQLGKKWFLFGWTAAVDADGVIWVGSWNYLSLPDQVSDKVKFWHELSQVIQDLRAWQWHHQKEWYIWMFTKGYINRTYAHSLQVISALVKWLNKDKFTK